jgi:ammonia channel protein AmtB
MNVPVSQESPIFIVLYIHVVFMQLGAAGLAGILACISPENGHSRPIPSPCPCCGCFAGFAMVEMGFARLTNVQNVLMKNSIDLGACAIAYWLTGYALSFGQGSLNNPFCGFSKFLLINAGDDDWILWFFNFTFLANSSAIFGGSIAGRSKFIACVLLNAFHSGFTYPIVAHWVRCFHIFDYVLCV